MLVKFSLCYADLPRPAKIDFLKVAGHPARSAARLRVEIEWEICHVGLSYHQNVWQKWHPKFKKTEVWDCPQTSLAASS